MEQRQFNLIFAITVCGLLYFYCLERSAKNKIPGIKGLFIIISSIFAVLLFEAVLKLTVLISPGFIFAHNILTLLMKLTEGLFFTISLLIGLAIAFKKKNPEK